MSASKRRDTHNRRDTAGTRRSLRARSLLVAGLTASTMVLAAPAWAAGPSSGSVGPSKSATSWSGHSYAAGATASPAACGAAGDTLCDHYSLSVPASASYWRTHTGVMHVSIGWGSSGDNFDLYVYKGGGLVGSSSSGSSKSESVSVSNPSGTYSIVVVPKLVTDSGYTGHASFSSQAKPSSGGSGGGSGGGGSGGGGSGGGGSGGSGGSGGGGSSSGGGGSTTGGGGSSGSSGGSSSGVPQVLQPGASHDFGSLSGPLFHYGGPFHFKPPFSVSDSPGHAVMPPQGGAISGGAGSTSGTSSGGGGSAVQPPPQAGGSDASDSRSGSNQPVRIRTMGGPHHGGTPGLIWLLVPLALIAAAAVWSVLSENQGRVAVPATQEASSERPVERAPAVGPFVALGFAVRRLVLRGRRGRNDS